MKGIFSNSGSGKQHFYAEIVNQLVRECSLSDAIDMIDFWANQEFINQELHDYLIKILREKYHD